MLDSSVSISNSQLLGVMDNHVYYFDYIPNNYYTRAFNLKTKKTHDVIGILFTTSAKASFNKIYTYSYDYTGVVKAKIFEIIEGIAVEGNIYEDLNLNCKRDA